MVVMKDWQDCTIKEKLDRWLNAERVLVKLPKHVRIKHWDMRHWGVVTECGTVCCAAGHCGLDPWFRKRGFKLKPVTLQELSIGVYAEGTDYRAETFVDLERDTAGGIEPGQGGFENDVRPGDFFGDGADNIFGNPKTRTVNEVIKEIRTYIAKLKKAIENINARRAADIKEARENAAHALKDELVSINRDYDTELSEV